MRKTIGNLLTEYGTVAVAVYLTIFALVLAGSWIAIQAGWAPESVAGRAGTFAAAYVVTKLTQPVRIAATVVLTPLIARLWLRLRNRRGPGGPGSGFGDASPGGQS